MNKNTLLILTFFLSLAVITGCDKKNDPAAPVQVAAEAAGSGAQAAGANAPIPGAQALAEAGQRQGAMGQGGAMPAGHPPVGGAGAQAAPAAGGPTGPVTEVVQAGTYTYLKLKAANGEIWAAVPRCDSKVGDTVTIAGAMEMRDFESKTLGRKFPSVWFGTLGTPGAPAAATGAVAALGGATDPAVPAGAQGGGHAKAGEKQVDKVEKAEGEGAVNIEELYGKRKDLSGKKVRIRGKVVRYSGGIMGKNWMHLQDGSGKVEDNTHDVTVTTRDTVKVGDVVTAIGTVGLDRDLGAGYHYEVLVEDAELQR